MPAVATPTAAAQVLGRLSHPNIVRLIAVCMAPPRLSLVMEAAETSLDKVVYGGGGAPGGGELLLPLPKVLHIAVQIAQGLAYLHPTVCHGDLKPANVLLNGASSDTPEVKLTDFGQAHIRMSTTFGSSRATLGALDAPAGGTAAFCAPECFDQAGGRAVAVTHKAVGVGWVGWGELHVVDSKRAWRCVWRARCCFAVISCSLLALTGHLLLCGGAVVHADWPGAMAGPGSGFHRSAGCAAGSQPAVGAFGAGRGALPAQAQAPSGRVLRAGPAPEAGGERSVYAHAYNGAAESDVLAFAFVVGG